MLSLEQGLKRTGKILHRVVEKKKKTKSTSERKRGHALILERLVLYCTFYKRADVRYIVVQIKKKTQTMIFSIVFGKLGRCASDVADGLRVMYVDERRGWFHVIDQGRNKARSLINCDTGLTSRPTGCCNAGELAGPFIYH